MTLYHYNCIKIEKKIIQHFALTKKGQIIKERTGSYLYECPIPISSIEPLFYIF